MKISTVFSVDVELCSERQSTTKITSNLGNLGQILMIKNRFVDSCAVLAIMWVWASRTKSTHLPGKD